MKATTNPTKPTSALTPGARPASWVRADTSGPVLFYLGMAIFGAVGLTIAGAILGAVA